MKKYFELEDIEFFEDYGAAFGNAMFIDVNKPLPKDVKGLAILVNTDGLDDEEIESIGDFVLQNGADIVAVLGDDFRTLVCVTSNLKEYKKGDVISL